MSEKILMSSKEDLKTIVDLESSFFGGERAETQEAYEFVLDNNGKVLIRYEGMIPRGMLATLPVDIILEKKDEISKLPYNSPFRKRALRGDFDGFSGYELVLAFVSERYSRGLTNAFRTIERAVGFVYEHDAKALHFYEKLDCKRIGTVANVHSPEIKDILLLYERK